MGNESSSLVATTNSTIDAPKSIEDFPEEVLNIIYQKLDSKNDEEFEYDYDYGDKANAYLVNASRVSKKWKAWIDGKIVTMNFSYMEKTQRIIYRIHRFYNLKSVHFGLTKFDYAAIFSALPSCPNLEELSIPVFKNIHTILRTFFSKNQNITSMHLTYFPSSHYPLPPFDSLLTLFPLCTKLKKFQLDLNLYEITISELNRIIDCMPLLTHLNLQKISFISNKSIVYILQKCPLLKVLQLEFASITDEVLLSISKCKNLEEIYLKSSTFQLENESILTLASPTFNGHTLNLTRCHDLNGFFSRTHKEIKFPSLLHLNLSYCKQIHDRDIRFLAKSCKNVRSLDLSYTKMIQSGADIFQAKFYNLKILRMGGDICTDNVLKLISLNCQHLNELTLTNAFHVTDNGIRHLVNGCKNIIVLHIKNDREKWSGRLFSEISGLGFDKPFPNLKSLVLGRCKLTDRGLNSILLHCSGLTRLEFYLCNEISYFGVLPYLIDSPKLKHFELNNCSEVSLENLISQSINYCEDQTNGHAYNKLKRIKIKGTNKSDVIYVEIVNNKWTYTPKDRIILGPYLILWFMFQHKTVCLRGVFFKFDFSTLVESLGEQFSNPTTSESELSFPFSDQV